MAVVYEVTQMMRELTEIIGRLNNAKNLLRNAKQMQEVLFDRGELTANIKTEMEEALAEIQDVIDAAVSDIQDIDFATWPDEVRIGSPVNYKELEIIDDQDGSHSLITFNDEGGTLLATHLFIVDDVVEIVTPEKARHAQTVIVDDTTADGDPADANPTTSGFHGLGVIPGSPDAQGIVNTDTKAKLILRER